jgi:molybdate transport system substrate-binding protein
MWAVENRDNRRTKQSHIGSNRVKLALIMVRPLRLALLAVACAAALAGTVPAQTPAPPKGRDVVVSAAISLSDVLQQLAPVYQARSGDRLILNLGPSNTLARQIMFGAGVDLFISADEAQMDAVAAQLAPGTRADLLANQLAIAVPDDRPRRFASARDLTDPAVRRIAIGDPAGVPAGVYAKRYLQGLGIWPQLEARVVPSGSVRLALAAVENGAADAAIVYHTDIATAPHAREALLIPAAEGPRIVYPAAVVRNGKNPEGARRVLEFLRGAEAGAAFARAGFLAPGSTER